MMPELKAEIRPNPDAVEPFLVVLTASGKIVASQSVTSEAAGEQLIEALMPTLKGFDITPPGVDALRE